MKRLFETAMIMMGTLGFWGFVYPEFCLTEATCEIAEGEETEAIWGPEKEVRIKSRVLEYVYLVRENTDREKE